MISNHLSKKRVAAPANERLEKIRKFIQENRFNRSLLRYIDWPLLLIVLALSLYGVLVIFCATGVPVDDPSLNIFEKVQLQSFTYPRLQLIWMAVSVLVIAAAIYLDYDRFKQWSGIIYGANIALLVFVLFMERMRGNMTGWFRWGEGRTFQPSEIAKIAIIIALANQFSNRKKPIRTVSELIPSLLTSLGILGTFIGLTRGLTGLDMTDANTLMNGIPILLTFLRDNKNCLEESVSTKH